MNCWCGLYSCCRCLGRFFEKNQTERNQQKSLSMKSYCPHIKCSSCPGKYTLSIKLCCTWDTFIRCFPSSFSISISKVLSKNSSRILNRQKPWANFLGNSRNDTSCFWHSLSFSACISLYVCAVLCCASSCLIFRMSLCLWALLSYKFEP